MSRTPLRMGHPQVDRIGVEAGTLLDRALQGAARWPCKAPDGDLVGRNLFLLDTSHEDSRLINACVSVHRCKRCYKPHEEEQIPQFLPWAMSSYVLKKYSDLSPPFHLTFDDVNMEIDSYHVTPRFIVSQRIL